MPERDGKDQGEDSLKSGLVLVRSPLLTSHKWRELVSSGRLVCRCHDVFLWCYRCFVLLRFRFFAFVEATTLHSIVLRFAGALIPTRASFLFSFCLFGDVALSECFSYHCRFLFVWRVYRTFFFPDDVVFLPCDHGLDFRYQLIKKIKKK